MTTYLTDSEGKFIPSSQRPDGTWRKARRVKEGYVPQEEVPLYESKGKQFAQRKTGLPPGMCPVVTEAAKKEREKLEKAKAKKDAAAVAAATATATATNKQQQQQQQQIPGVIVLPTTGNKNTAKTSNKATPANSKSNNEVAINELSNNLQTNLTLQDDTTQDLLKKLKKLRKKLREIETIEEKIKSGELKKPEKDQLDKVKRKKEIKKELAQVEEEAAYLEALNTEDK